jgi:ATP adenylyltransferase
VNHEQLWAPWRLAYVSGEPDGSQSEGKGAAAQQPVSANLLPGADDTCFLCQAAVCLDARQRFVVQQGEHSVTVLNRFPYNNGHLLIAPNRHLARLDQLAPAEQLDLLGTITQMIGLLERTVRAEGFNVGLNLGQVAGAGLPGHVHWHIVPRWHGDTNFMPTLAGIRVIPQSLEALWNVLTEAIGPDRSAQDSRRDS